MPRFLWERPPMIISEQVSIPSTAVLFSFWASHPSGVAHFSQPYRSSFLEISNSSISPYLSQTSKKVLVHLPQTNLRSYSFSESHRSSLACTSFSPYLCRGACNILYTSSAPSFRRRLARSAGSHHTLFRMHFDPIFSESARGLNLVVKDSTIPYNYFLL